jgi:Fe-S oxidoreductase
VHVRIGFDLVTDPGIEKFRSFIGEASDLVISHGGSLSGEHGDGQARAEFLNRMYSPELLKAFREFKSIWDPQGKMNPGKIVDPFLVDSNLRVGTDYNPLDTPTYFQFPEDHGSFAKATLKCVGIGKCRKAEGATMCPSFRVTHDEKHTTRGRARILFEMLQGDIVKEGWGSEAVKEALDLCLACKGCKRDCPVNVDMATYKSEFLAHYYQKKRRPRSAYAFGFIDRWAELASVSPGLANFFTQSPGLSAVSKRIAGAAPQRAIPKFAKQTFKSWFFSRQPRLVRGKKVVLWADTFNNYFHPEVARDAVETLESLGFHPVVPRGHLCCGRPLYDYGFLDEAKLYLRRVLDVLRDEIRQGTPVVGLEPSCISVFRDELRGLMPHNQDGRRLSELVVPLAEFILREVDEGSTPRLQQTALVHGHCHHKADYTMSGQEQLLKRMGVDAQILDSGCCGMAGSFGFEHEGEKYDVSMKVGERVPLPAVRSASESTLILSDGFSCRSQITGATDRRPIHIAQLMNRAIQGKGTQ